MQTSESHKKSCSRESVSPLRLVQKNIPLVERIQSRGRYIKGAVIVPISRLPWFHGYLRKERRMIVDTAFLPGESM